MSKFEERYPNWRTEYRNEKITHMSPANGWWKVLCDDEGNSWIEPVAFFATIEYERRSVWDGGSHPWLTDRHVYANSGAHEMWFNEFAEVVTNNCQERLFYDPDFRLSRDEQNAGDQWLNELKASRNKRKEST